MSFSRVLAFAAAFGLTAVAFTPPASAGAPPKRASAAQRASFKDALTAGRKAMKSKDFKGAIAKFEAALAIVPTSTSVLGELGWALFQDGQLDPAEQRTDKAIELSKRAKQLGALHYNLGRIKEAQGKKDEARREYSESLAYRDNETVRARVETLGGVLIDAREVDGHATFEAALGDNAYCAEPTPKASAGKDARCTWDVFKEVDLSGGGLDEFRLITLEGSADDIGGSVDVAAILLRRGTTWYNTDLVADSWTPGVDYISNSGELEDVKTGDLLPDVPGQEVLVTTKESSVDHDPGVEMTTSDMMRTWNLCAMVGDTPICVAINYEVEWESNQLEADWEAGKKIDGQKWAMSIAIEGSTIVIATAGKPDALPPVSQACLGRHTFEALTKKACANAAILK